MISQQLLEVRERVNAAAARSGRLPQSIELIAVSKLMPAAVIESAVAAGQYGFGENYVQEAQDKFQLKSPKSNLRERCPQLRLHLIGALQSNKAKDVVGAFDVIQTVHKIELAVKIAELAQRKALVQQVMIQVNISGEASKSGVEPAAVEPLAQAILARPSLQLLGLMIIGSYIEPTNARAERVREFTALRTLRDNLEHRLGVAIPQLSMGMSHDFELAIEEGATMVRVGSAIFGERKLSASARPGSGSSKTVV